MRICNSCNTEKELEEFSTYLAKDRTRKPRGKCKECFNSKYNKHYYDVNKDKYRTSSRMRREENTSFVQQYKEDHGCIRCGETKYWRLAFHHLGDKEENVATLLTHSLTRIKKEIAKCVVVCHNCHADIHHEERNAQ